jgi:hypothetical protein
MICLRLRAEQHRIRRKRHHAADFSQTQNFVIAREMRMLACRIWWKQNARLKNMVVFCDAIA